MTTKIECPICYDNNANCWWTSDTDGTTYTWIIWHHECEHCGYSVKKVEQFPYDEEDIENCTIPGHRKASSNSISHQTINHSLNTNINYDSGKTAAANLKRKVKELERQLAEFQEFGIKAEKQGGVFISYSHADKDVIERIVVRFDADNINYWLDEQDLLVGDVIDEVISEGIQDNWLFLVILTPTSVESRWVARELDEAFHEEIEGNKIILPVVAKNLPITKIPARLRRKKHVDLSEDFNAGYGELSRAINKHLAQHAK